MLIFAAACRSGEPFGLIRQVFHEQLTAAVLDTAK